MVNREVIGTLKYLLAVLLVVGGVLAILAFFYGHDF